MKPIRSIRAIGVIAGAGFALGLVSCETTTPQTSPKPSPNHSPHDQSSEPATSAASNPSAKAKPYPLDLCLVSDEELDSMGGPITRVHEGQEIKFCCKGCVKDFDDDPEKYLAKLR